jgi:hypothetical protein
VTRDMRGREGYNTARAGASGAVEAWWLGCGGTRGTQECRCAALGIISGGNADNSARAVAAGAMEARGG